MSYGLLSVETLHSQGAQTGLTVTAFSKIKPAASLSRFGVMYIQVPHVSTPQIAIGLARIKLDWAFAPHYAIGFLTQSRARKEREELAFSRFFFRSKQVRRTLLVRS